MMTWFDTPRLKGRPDLTGLFVDLRPRDKGRTIGWDNTGTDKAHAMVGNCGSLETIE
jgi:hypothetical protein